MSTDFAQLVGTREWEDFRAALLGRRSFVKAETASPERFAGLWAEWEVAALCRFTAAPHDHERFRLISRAKQVPPGAYTDRLGAFREEAFRQLRAGGASLAAGGWENYSNRALALSRELEREFQRPAQVNLYITPPASQGLGAHVDPHDVLILQIQGEKVWDVYPAPRTESSEFVEQSPRKSGADQIGFERVVLKPGGWLFLPKGTRHEVRNEGAATSVHFTVGFHPLTWGEVFQRALNRSRVANPDLNEVLLPDNPATATKDEMGARLRSILAAVDLSDHLSGYYAAFPSLGVRVPDGQTGATALHERMNETAVFAWREGAVFSLGGVGIPQIDLSYRRVPLVFRPECAERLKRMAELKTFTPAALEGSDCQETLLLCRFLAGVGVLAGPA